MNRKPVIIAVSFVVVLLAAIIFLFLLLFNDKKTSSSTDEKERVGYRTFEAVPSDGIMLAHFNTFKLLHDISLNGKSQISSLINKEAPLLKFVDGVKDICSEETIISMHYSDKDEISLLFVNSISKADSEGVLSEVLTRFPQSSRKQYGSAVIIGNVSSGVFFSVYKDFLIAGTSQILVESSLRHIDNAISIIDNKDFRDLLNQKSGDLSLMVNYRQIGKFFSGSINRPYLKYADFLSRFTTWSMTNYKYDNNTLTGSGTLLNTKKEENYSSIFAGKKQGESNIYRVTPYSANFVFSLNIGSQKDFRKDYITWLDANKKKGDYTYILSSMKPSQEGKLSPQAWFESLDISEIGVVSLPLGESKDERVMLVRTRSKSLSAGVGEVAPFEYKGYLSALIGEWFAATSEDFCINITDWLVVGSEDALGYFRDMYADGSFTMYNYLNQLSIYNVPKGENHLSMAVNLINSAPIIEKIFRKELIIYPLRGMAGNNVSFVQYSLTSDKKRLSYSTELKIENVNNLPQPKYFSKDGELMSSVSVIARLVVPQGPFEAKNFVTGKMNYLEQQPNNMLRLLDENKKGVWTIPFDYPLCGYVEQVDHYKNGKLQMLFAASDKIWILDRLGRFVRSYPVSVGKSIALGPKVWDFNNDRNYSIMLLHDDNTIGLYNIKGEKYTGWSDITAKEQIISLPERLVVGDKYYWVLRTPVQTLIFNSLGVIIADFSRKNIINPDTEINIVSSNELELTTIEDKKVILNLEKGTFKRN